jgi:hypothetical protein
MNATAPAQNRHHARRANALRQLGQTGPFLEGSLCSFKRPGCTAPGWHLTFKQKGHTRTVYVPMDLVAEVKSWTRNYRRLKRLIREVTRQSLGLICGHVARRRAAQRAGSPRRRSTGNNPRPSRPGAVAGRNR